MRYGMPYASGYGDARQTSLVELSLDQNGLAIEARVTPAPGRGDALFGVVQNAKWVGNYTLDEAQTRLLMLAAAGAKSSVYVFRLGKGSGAYTNDRLARYDDALDARRVTLLWNWDPVYVGAISSESADTQASGWSLTGVAFAHLDRADNLRYRIPYTITVTGGVATVQLGRADNVLASGSGPVNTTVALTGTLPGSVAVSAGCVSHTGFIEYHYPQSMRILRGTSNPPATVVATVPFNLRDSQRWTEASDLTAGTHYYALQLVSAEGDAGDVSAAVAETIIADPAPATNLHYVSHTGADCVVAWTASITAGVTYTVWSDGADGIMRKITETAGLTATVPVMSDGVSHVLVRAEKDNVAETNTAYLTLTFAASVLQAAKPNVPQIVADSVKITNSRTVTLQGAYDATGEAAAATKLALYVRPDSGAYDWGTPAAVVNLSAFNDTWKLAALSATLTGNGYWFASVKSRTAGDVESAASAETRLYVSDTNLAAPAFEARKTRG